MNVSKVVAAITLAALVIPTQVAYGGLFSSLDYIVSEDTTTELKLTVNHDFSTFGSKTWTLKPTLTNWSVGGSLVDFNAGLISAGIDSVTLKNMTVQHLSFGGGPVFSVPTTTVFGIPAKSTLTVPLIKFTQSQNHGTDIDNVEVVGTYKTTGITRFGITAGADIDAYNFVVIGDHTTGQPAKFALASALSGSNESTAVASAAFGTFAGLYDAGTNQLDLEMGIAGLQASDITGIQITSNAPGFTTLDLGTSALVNGSSGVSFGEDVSIPQWDLSALEAGNAFVNVLTQSYPNGEIGGMLSTVDTSSVPEPSSLFLLASGLAGLAWWRRKIAV